MRKLFRRILILVSFICLLFALQITSSAAANDISLVGMPEYYGDELNEPPSLDFSVDPNDYDVVCSIDITDIGVREPDKYVISFPNSDKSDISHYIGHIVADVDLLPGYKILYKCVDQVYNSYDGMLIAKIEYYCSVENTEHLFSTAGTIGNGMDVFHTDNIKKWAYVEFVNPINDVSSIDDEFSFAIGYNFSSYNNIEPVITIDKFSNENVSISPFSSDYFISGNKAYIYFSGTNNDLMVVKNDVYTQQFETIIYSNYGGIISTPFLPDIFIGNDSSSDDIPPSVTMVASGGISSWTNKDVNVTIFASDNKELATPTSLWVNNQPQSSSSVNLNISSPSTVSAYAKDSAGNISETKSLNISKIDKTSPTLTVSNPAVNKNNATFDVTYSDAGGSGINSVTVNGVQLTGQTYTVYFDGTYTVEATDNAGNKTSKSVTISGIDSVPPSVTVLKSTTGWTNMPVTVNVYSSDNNKLATSYPLYVNGQGYASGEFEKTFTANQQNAISAYAKDAAGNVSPTKTVSIDNIDTIAPVWSGSVTYSSDKSAATITALATDAGGSGLKKLNANGADRPLTGYTWTVNSNGLYAIMATDNAGNVLNYYVPVTSIDTTPPNISVQWNPSANTITKQTTLKFTVSDDNPHATPLSISIDGVSQGTNLANGYTLTVDRNCSITVTAKDAAGNTKTDTISVNNIDTIPPVVSSVTTNYNSWTNQPVIATVTASDDKALHSAPYQYTFEPISGGSTSTGWTSSRTYTVTDNGTLKVQVRDSVGNLSTVYSKVIDFIDKLPPTATVTYTPDLSTLVTPEEGTSVRIEVVDQAIPGLLSNSGIGGSYIQWQDQTNWTSSNTRTFNENRTYYYRVRDNAGNMSAFIAVPITNIRTDAPHIISFTSTGGTGDWFKAPALLTVIAEAPDGAAALDSRPYSWDNGLTWTSDNTKQVTESGTYSVIVRNTLGQTSTSSITLTALDGGKPSVDTSLIKRPPADNPDAPEDEWVWWIKVDATDDGSGISSITNVSTGETSTTSPAYFEINDADRIDFEVVDNVGNTATDYIVVEDWVLGSNDNSDPALEPGQPIIPTEKPGSVQVDLTGDIGLDDAKISDLIFGTNGVYNKKTNQYADYLNPASAIIKYSTEFKTDPERTLNGSMTFAGNNYNVSFGSVDPTTGIVVATGSIPVSSISRDINNGRLEVSIEEKSEDEIVRVGSVQTTTSVQITPPSLNHTYNRALDKMLLTATSTVAGIREITYQLDGGVETEYIEPFSIGSASTIVLKVVDNVGSEFSYSLSASDLSINNGTDGLPTVDIPAGSDIEVYHSSNRTADIFIIGGSRTNTTQMPSSSIFSNAS